MLARHGFDFDNSRSYRRIDRERGSVEVINFQLGQRSLEGRFTVNLGWLSREYANDVELARARVYQCRYQQRIGLLLPPRFAWATKLPVLGFLFGARDRWWRFDADADFTREQLRRVTALLEAHAIPWLESRTAIEAPNANADA